MGLAVQGREPGVWGSWTADSFAVGSWNSPDESGAATVPTVPLSLGTACSPSKAKALVTMEHPPLCQMRLSAASAFPAMKIMCLLLEGSKALVF